MLAEAMGARSYLELGTGNNETIARVRCEKRYGVDLAWVQCPGVTQFTMPTEKFIAEHAAIHAPYDFVFIDAFHTYESVENDFKGIWPHVTDEGLVLLHDSNPETLADTDGGLCGSVFVLAKNLHDQGYESVTLPYHPGLTIIRKRKQWGPVA